MLSVEELQLNFILKFHLNRLKVFKYFVNSGLYNNSAFYRVIENTLVQAGDLEFGYHDNINYFKVGSGGSKLGKLKSELSNDYEFKAGTVAMARGEFDTEDSEFFIILKDIPLYQGEYTPVGKVIFGLDALKKLKLVIKQIMYCGLIILKNFSY
mgnify:CR=1 FL=1